MPFQVISPMLMNVDGSDFNEAVKNFVKLNRHLHINDLILTDQINNMRANIRYYNRGGRNKAGIRLYPTTDRVITPLPGTSMSVISNGTFGFGQPSALVGKNGQIHPIEQVVPLTLDGQTLSNTAPIIGVTPSSLMGVGARGPIMRPTIVAPMIPPTPVIFGPAPATSTSVEWVDNTDNKVPFSDEIEKAYANVRNKNVKTTVVVRDLIKSLPPGTNVNLEFENDICKVSYTQPTGGLFETHIKRKGPSSSGVKIMVAATPRLIGPLPRF